MGRTTSDSTWLKIDARNALPCEFFDGAISADGRIWGCYLHGLFANTAFRHAWLTCLGWNPEHRSFSAQASDQLERSLDHLADEVQAAIDMSGIERILWAD
jgi:adenosylcobyric acid synthase